MFNNFLEDEALFADAELGPQFQSQKLFLRTCREQIRNFNKTSGISQLLMHLSTNLYMPTSINKLIQDYILSLF